MSSREPKPLEFTGERVVPGEVDAPLWAEHVARYQFASRFVRHKSVLDFACGTGYGSEILERAGALRVVGCDISASAVRYAAAHHPGTGIDWVVADCLASSFTSSSFDVVVSFETIEHVSSHQKFLSEVKRLLRPDGLLIVSTPNEATYSEPDGATDNPFHTREFELADFRDAVSRHFPTLRLFGQSTIDGPLFMDLEQHHLGHQLRLLDGPGQHLATAERFDFFIAVCGNNSTIDLAAQPCFYPGATDELHSLRRRLRALQREFEQRTAWAREIEQEVEARGRRLLDQRDEFTERTRWALSLERQVAERDARIYALEAEREDLKRRVEQLSARLAELETKTPASSDDG